MRLKKYIESEKITLKRFCEKNDFSYAHFRILSCGAKVPSFELAYRIEKATRGRVTVKDWPVLYRKMKGMREYFGRSGI